MSKKRMKRRADHLHKEWKKTELDIDKLAENMIEAFSKFNTQLRCPNCKNKITENNVRICPECGNNLVTHRTLKENKDFIRTYVKDLLYEQSLIIRKLRKEIRSLKGEYILEEFPIIENNCPICGGKLKEERSNPPATSFPFDPRPTYIIKICKKCGHRWQNTLELQET